MSVAHLGFPRSAFDVQASSCEKRRRKRRRTRDVAQFYGPKGRIRVRIHAGIWIPGPRQGEQQGNQGPSGAVSGSLGPVETLLGCRGTLCSLVGSIGHTHFGRKELHSACSLNPLTAKALVDWG